MRSGTFLTTSIWSSWSPTCLQVSAGCPGDLLQPPDHDGLLDHVGHGGHGRHPPCQFSRKHFYEGVHFPQKLLEDTSLHDSPSCVVPHLSSSCSRGVLITPSRGGIDQTTLSHSVHHHGQTALTDSLLLWIDRALKRKKMNRVFSRTEFTKLLLSRSILNIV